MGCKYFHCIRVNSIANCFVYCNCIQNHIAFSKEPIIMFLDHILGLSSTVCRAFPWLWLFSIKRYILPNVIFVFYKLHIMIHILAQIDSIYCLTVL